MPSLEWYYQQIPKDKTFTISEFCELFDIDNEFDVMEIVAKLQRRDWLILFSCKTIYRDDGGCLLLAQYKIKE